jgi:hypothetical protein
VHTFRQFGAAAILCGLCVAGCGSDASRNPVAADTRLANFTKGRTLLAEPGAVLLPDLTIDAQQLKASMLMKRQVFTASDCAIVEQCVSGTGRRSLLRFDVVTPNIGPVDLTLGNPANSSLFQYSACHGHYHFSGYAQYDLLGPDGAQIMTGRKQAFCLEDFSPSSSNAHAPRYTCANQGISAGWQDEYDSSLDCQWLDVTDIHPGNYQLRISINPLGLLQESDRTNNVATVPLTFGKDGALVVKHGR